MTNEIKALISKDSLINIGILLMLALVLDVRFFITQLLLYIIMVLLLGFKTSTAGFLAALIMVLKLLGTSLLVRI